MELLKIDELESAVRSKFAPDEIRDYGFILRPSKLTEKAVQVVEQRLGVLFPEEFRRFILTYELAGVDVGWVNFDTGTNYGEVLLHDNLFHNWSEEDERPHNYLLIAGTDGYSIVLDTKTGEVYAFDTDEYWEDREKIADSFLLFFRGAATYFLKHQTDPEVTGRAVAVRVGADADCAFWN